ncbi:MAG: aminotransferase class IV [Bacillota bacterium]
MGTMKNEISFASNLAKYGMGLFETIKVINGRAVFLDEHLERLYNSINQLGISFELNKELLEQRVEEYVTQLDNQALRITVCDRGYNFSTRDISYQTEDYKRGFELEIATITKGENPLDYHKTCNYFTNIQARKGAQANGYDEALFLNANNFVLEATMANIFFIKDGKLYTPKLELGLLPGIIRSKVILSAQELGVEVKEVVIDKPELVLFDFAFISNSLLGLMKVKAIESSQYNEESQIFKNLQQKLKEKEMRS